MAREPKPQEQDREAGESREMREREAREASEGSRSGERPADVGHRREATAEDIARENE